jgi:hypothetical protein
MTSPRRRDGKEKTNGGCVRLEDSQGYTWPTGGARRPGLSPAAFGDEARHDTVETTARQALLYPAGLKPGYIKYVYFFIIFIILIKNYLISVILKTMIHIK